MYPSTEPSIMPLELRCYDELSASQILRWTRFHYRCAQAHPYQTAWHAAARAAALKLRHLYWEICDRNDPERLRSTAVVEIFAHPIIGFSQGVIARGPVVADAQDLDECLRLVTEEAGRHNLSIIRVAPFFRSIDAPLPTSVLTARHFSSAPDNSGYTATTWLDLNKSAEEIFAQFHAKLRAEIRRSGERTAEIRPLKESHDITAALNVAAALSDAKGVPPPSESFLSSLTTHFSSHPEDGLALGMWENGLLVSFGIFLGAGQEMVYEYGASQSAADGGGRSHLLLWHAIREAKRLGFSQFNLGGVDAKEDTPQSRDGVSRFKRRFGGTPGETCPDAVRILKPGSEKIYRSLKKIQQIIERDNKSQQKMRDEQAADYDAWYARERGKAFLAVEHGTVLKTLELHGSESVLELGAGTGRITRVIAPHCKFIAAVDTSEKSLAVLRRQSGTETCPLQSDITAPLPFESATFDRVVSVQVIQHVHADTHMAIYSEALRVLKPGGRLVFTGYRLGRWISGEPDRYSGALYEHAFTAEEICEKLSEAGFGEIHISGLLTLHGRAYGLSKRLPWLSPVIAALDRAVAKSPIGAKSAIFLLVSARRLC